MAQCFAHDIIAAIPLVEAGKDEAFFVGVVGADAQGYLRIGVAMAIMMDGTVVVVGQIKAGRDVFDINALDVEVVIDKGELASVVVDLEGKAVVLRVVGFISMEVANGGEGDVHVLTTQITVAGIATDVDNVP